MAINVEIKLEIKHNERKNINRQIVIYNNGNNTIKQGSTFIQVKDSTTFNI